MRLDNLFAPLVARWKLIPVRWKLAVGYGSFAVASFVFFLYVTFPYEAARQRVTAEAGALGWTVKIGSMGPGLYGVTARDVQLQPVESALPAGQEAPAGLAGGRAPKGPAQISISSLAARPALFPPGVAVRAAAFGGVITGSFGFLGDLKISASADGLDPADGGVKSLSGVDAAGSLDGDLSLSLPREQGPRAPSGFDLSRASGAITLSLTKGLVKGGTATVPLYGQMTPVDLPRISFGDLEGKIKFEKGVGTVERLHSRSEDLELQGSGTVTLARRLDFSELNIQLKVKAEPEFTKRLGMLGAALTVLPPDKADPAYRVAAISGFLGNPRLAGFPR